MSFFDKFITKDGTVDSLVKHMAISVGIGLGLAIVIHVLNALAFPLAIAGGLYVGYKTYEADKRINGE